MWECEDMLHRKSTSGCRPWLKYIARLSSLMTQMKSRTRHVSTLKHKERKL